jgi:hypothetical protein
MHFILKQDIYIYIYIYIKLSWHQLHNTGGVNARGANLSFSGQG